MKTLEIKGPLYVLEDYKNSTRVFKSVDYHIEDQWIKFNDCPGARSNVWWEHTTSLEHLYDNTGRFQLISKNKYIMHRIYDGIKNVMAIGMFIAVPWALIAISGIIDLGKHTWFLIGASISMVWILVALKILNVR